MFHASRVNGPVSNLQISKTNGTRYGTIFSAGEKFNLPIPLVFPPFLLLPSLLALMMQILCPSLQNPSSYTFHHLSHLTFAGVLTCPRFQRRNNVCVLPKLMMPSLKYVINVIL
jgi:hypothetical protein